MNSFTHLRALLELRDRGIFGPGILGLVPWHSPDKDTRVKGKAAPTIELWWLSTLHIVKTDAIDVNTSRPLRGRLQPKLAQGLLSLSYCVVDLSRYSSSTDKYVIYFHSHCFNLHLIYIHPTAAPLEIDTQAKYTEYPHPAGAQGLTTTHKNTKKIQQISIRTKQEASQEEDEFCTVSA